MLRQYPAQPFIACFTAPVAINACIIPIRCQTGRYKDRDRAYRAKKKRICKPSVCLAHGDAHARDAPSTTASGAWLLGAMEPDKPFEPAIKNLFRAQAIASPLAFPGTDAIVRLDQNLSSNASASARSGVQGYARSLDNDGPDAVENQSKST